MKIREGKKLRGRLYKRRKREMGRGNWKGEKRIVTMKEREEEGDEKEDGRRGRVN